MPSHLPSPHSRGTLFLIHFPFLACVCVGPFLLSLRVMLTYVMFIHKLGPKNYGLVNFDNWVIVEISH